MPLSPFQSGKVRELYAVGDDKLLLVASDRISAFDVVLPQPIPDKGRVLTAMTVHWLDLLADVGPSHFITADPAELPATEDLDGQDTDIAGRAMLVHKADMLPLECIVRGYLAGSAWKEYSKSGTVHGMSQPKGMQQADAFEEPIFTPSTKAEEGHDVNLSYDEAVDVVGKEIAEQSREMCLEAYRRAATAAEAQGFVVADTKFELGWIDGKLSFCDEILTPDSSRFWPKGGYERGSNPPSYDKQPVRDWLEAAGWDKQPPPPDLPPEIVRETSDRYIAAYERISGRKLSDWYGA
ncbi:MAG: phosphoribosylaminoimidazolesuccinocarboxamide synthase [Acidimicrobiales bacterium]